MQRHDLRGSVMWCAHDEVILLPGITSCGLHTFGAALILLATGAVATSYALYVRRAPSGDGQRRVTREQTALAAGIAVAALLVSHAALAILDASPGRAHERGWHADPSRLFSALACCLFYTVLAALLLVGHLGSVPVPCVRTASQVFVGVYTLRTAIVVELYNAGTVHGGALVLTSLQLMGLLCFAIVATVRCAAHAFCAPPRLCCTLCWTARRVLLARVQPRFAARAPAGIARELTDVPGTMWSATGRNS